MNFLNPDKALRILRHQCAEYDLVLETSAPWELAPSVIRLLNEIHPYPWAQLVGLAAGTKMIEAKMGEFVIADYLSIPRPAELLDAYRVNLCPPAAAAALYVAIDLHPIWGLRIGRGVNADTFTLTEKQVYNLVHDCIDDFECKLRGTPGGHLASLAEEYMAGIETLLANVSNPPEGVFGCYPIDTERSLIVSNMMVRDLFRYVYQPAGVVTIDEYDQYHVNPEFLG